MDEQRVKQAVLDAIDRSIDAHALALAVRGATSEPAAAPPTPGTQKLLERIVLGDILDDAILAARPSDRTFPLRLFFGELGTLLAGEVDAPPKAGGADATIAEAAFTLASGLNFFFRAEMESEAKIRVGIEVSRQLYSLAHVAKLDADLLAKAAPLLASLMSQDLERVKFESIDHTKVFDSQVHERAEGSDPSGSRILRPASFLCRVTTNNAVKAKAQVVT